MFLGPFCHSKWTLILIYTPLSRWQHLHMSTRRVNLIRHAQTACYYSAAWDWLHVSMFMIYIHSHTQAHTLFYSFGQMGRQCGPAVREAVKWPQLWSLLQQVCLSVDFTVSHFVWELNAWNVNIRALFNIIFYLSWIFFKNPLHCMSSVVFVSDKVPARMESLWNHNNVQMQNVSLNSKHMHKQNNSYS